MITDFFKWIEAEFPASDGPITLVAHNGLKFDAKFLVKTVRRLRMWRSMPKQLKEGLVADSLPLVRAKFPFMYRHRLVDLVNRFLPDEQGDQHEAMADTLQLKGIVEHVAKLSMKNFGDLFHNSNFSTPLAKIR